MLTVRIPRIFAQDRQDRGLSNGTGYWTKTCFVGTLNDDELMDLESDADLYGNAPSGSFESDFVDVPRSAKRTLQAIQRAKENTR